MSFCDKLLSTTFKTAHKWPFSSLYHDNIEHFIHTWVRKCVLRFPVSVNSLKQFKNGQIKALVSPLTRLAF